MKKYIIALLSTMLIFLTSCGNYNTAEGMGLFAKITVDNSKTLTTEPNIYHYYYLKDTGIIYVGYISQADYLSSSEIITPVISENGNYFIYDTKNQEAVEIKEKE